ncbi:hypothetical protein [Clostridium thermobutyricum]|uniref:hypothetical protein n=1 Tax=Clostridium thermobutyricum TaxID=29372 RepID=UPI0029422CD6|nr:hypothetical protein [Clostridium thermobutyricum]
MDIQIISNEEFEKYLCASHIPKKLFMAFNNGWYRGLDNVYSNEEVRTFDNEEDCKIWLQTHVD